MTRTRINGRYMDKIDMEGSGGKNWKNVLHTCPVCEAELKTGISRSQHLQTHQPEDFGLSPLME